MSRKKKNAVKRIFAASLAMMLVSGVLPWQPVNDVLGVAVSANAAAVTKQDTGDQFDTDDFSLDSRTGIYIDKTFQEQEVNWTQLSGTTVELEIMEWIKFSVYDENGNPVACDEGANNTSSAIYRYTFEKESDKTYYLVRNGINLDDETVGGHIVFRIPNSKWVNHMQSVKYTGEPVEAVIENFLDPYADNSLFEDSEGNFDMEAFSQCIDVVYENNINVGTAELIFKAKENSGFVGSYVYRYQIEPAQFTDVDFNDPMNPIVYFNNTILERDKDYTVENNGGSTIVTGINNFNNVWECFSETEIEFSECNITVTPNVYEGVSFRPVITVEYDCDDDVMELVEGQDYVFTLLNDSGEEVEMVTGPGTYYICLENPNTGNRWSQEYTVTSLAVSLGDCDVLLTPDVMVYTGTAFTPTVKVVYTNPADNSKTTLEEGKDYTVEFADSRGNIVEQIEAAGEYSVILENLNDDGDVYEEDFEVLAKPKLSMCEINVIPETPVYKGTAFKPEISVTYTNPITNDQITLKEGEDYRLSFKNATGDVVENITSSGDYSVEAEDLHYVGECAELDFTVEEHIHSYDKPVWQWADDHLSASAVFECTECGETKTVNADAAVEKEAAATIYKVVAMIDYTIYEEQFVQLLENTSSVSADTIQLGQTVTVNLSASEAGNGERTYAVLYKKTSDKSWKTV